jgi:hypothetical protein
LIAVRVDGFEHRVAAPEPAAKSTPVAAFGALFVASAATPTAVLFSGFIGGFIRCIGAPLSGGRWLAPRPARPLVTGRLRRRRRSRH